MLVAVIYEKFGWLSWLWFVPWAILLSNQLETRGASNMEVFLAGVSRGS